ncbi:MAG: GntR family transcriptional regulator, partial [Polaromonas sp.]
MSPELPMPKYHRIYLVLREQLHEGKFSQGLPGEMALMQQFGVARVTVRRALELLAAEGLISREPGRGTRALDLGASNGAANGEGGPRARFTGLLENLVSMGLNTSVSVLDVEVVRASANVANALQLKMGDLVQK